MPLGGVLSDLLGNHSVRRQYKVVIALMLISVPLRVNQTVGGDFSLPVASARLENLVNRSEWPCD
jgi:hypothetical protein